MVGRAEQTKRKNNPMKMTCNSRTCRHLMTQIGVLRIVKRLTLASVAALLTWTAPESAKAQTTATTDPVGIISNMAVQLLTAPLTAAQRQVLHAQNFNSLPPAARPVYLHSVAYAIGFAVSSNGQVPDSKTLQAHLASTASIYFTPPFPALDAQRLAAVLPSVHATLNGLNILIATQVANTVAYQTAIDAGAVCGCVDAADYVVW
jgi:hypothetical protein